jgi:hypothetical protein
MRCFPRLMSLLAKAARAAREPSLLELLCALLSSVPQIPPARWAIALAWRCCFATHRDLVDVVRRSPESPLVAATPRSRCTATSPPSSLLARRLPRLHGVIVVSCCCAASPSTPFCLRIFLVGALSVSHAVIAVLHRRARAHAATSSSPAPCSPTHRQLLCPDVAGISLARCHQSSPLCSSSIHTYILPNPALAPWRPRHQSLFAPR